jgi:hypothetical protein
MADLAVQPRWSIAESVYVLVTVVSATLLAILITYAYYFLGWHRMASACQPDGTSRGVSYSHSWTRGFICTSDDGHQQAKFWW